MSSVSPWLFNLFCSARLIQGVRVWDKASDIGFGSTSLPLAPNERSSLWPRVKNNFLICSHPSGPEPFGILRNILIRWICWELDERFDTTLVCVLQPVSLA